MTFAVVHFSVAFAVGYLVTGSVMLGGLLALIEPAVNTVAYYLHERLWARWAMRGRSRLEAEPAGVDVGAGSRLQAAPTG